MKLSLFAYKSQKRPIDRLDGPSDKNRPTDSWMGIHARTFISVRVLEWKERKKEAGKRKLKEERKDYRRHFDEEIQDMIPVAVQSPIVPVQEEVTSTVAAQSASK